MGGKAVPDRWDAPGRPGGMRAGRVPARDAGPCGDADPADGVRVRLERLAVGYGGAPVVEGIDLAVRSGEITTLIGPNGSGKSTILKSVARQLEPMGGTVYLDGRPMGRMRATDVARSLSVLMTERVNPELMTCEDVVATGRYPYTGRLGLLGDADRACVAASLELACARDLADRPFADVSDGQRQRVMLARALCQEPDAMVLDEPTSYLDIRHKLELLSILKEMVRARGIAVLMSLHELDLAQRVSDTVACVRDGRVERVGTPEEVFATGYIAELYGIARGVYDTGTGSVEMPSVPGRPEVFVIGGNGRGIATYRALQRAGVPFAAGVIHENDRDMPVARALAARVVAAPAFGTIDDAAFDEAVGLVRSCGRVMCCLGEGDVGVGNARNADLANAARAMGKEVRCGV